MSVMSPCKLTLLFFELTEVHTARTSAYIRKIQQLKTREGERGANASTLEHPRGRHVGVHCIIPATYMTLENISDWKLKKRCELKNKIHQVYPLVWEVLSSQAMSLTSWGPSGTSPKTPRHFPVPRLLAWPACGNRRIELQGDCCNYVLSFHLPCRTPSENVEDKLMIRHASLMTTVLCAS